ncbi:uncharacterized protein C3orf38 homolog isoform X2 [Dreissena polymorpha]|uniref:Uncharacterized protein n=1 Tax=Dreissena polymorpha TaxID=45954 RepID=A0A9D4QNY4_DREPO|nr:uncharacterized protein C3orf38 homolog isoform X2 [Dreissena polymorpha]KAH3837030.1 hypothetical protein DPMN_110408 [Dreissena polymorpha]
MCSESAVKLLKRKKIRRDTLLQYLMDKKVAVAANTDKSGLIQVILQQWGSHIKEQDLEIKDEEDTSSSSPASSASGYSSQTSASTTYQNDRHGSFENRREQDGYKQKLPELRDQPLQQGLFYSSWNNTELYNLGQSFCKWFYENVNSFNPALGQTPADFGPHHFLSDAFLVIISHTTGIRGERFEGAILTAQRFVAFAKDELLLFNPNISSEGVFVKSDPCGVVVILVCGTIHRDHSCLGIFQQLFTLIKHPWFEKWKIKEIKLNVKTSSVACMPKLDTNPEKQIELLAVLEL